MTTINELEVTEIREKIVAIVKFGPAGFPSDGTRPAEYYQVTIDPACISPSGEFIRFGQTQGDEILGWQRAAAITIVEVLGSYGELSADNLKLEYGKSGVVSMPLLIKTNPV